MTVSGSWTLSLRSSSPYRGGDMGTASNVQVDEEVRKRGGSSQEDTGMAGVEGTFKLLTRAATTCLGTMGLLGVEFHLPFPY